VGRASVTKVSLEISECRKASCVFLDIDYILLRRCECDLHDYSSSRELDNQCREPFMVNNETSLASVCSDRGECFCGQCVCNMNFEGRYCECDLCPT
jgi:EGF-like domain